MASDSDHGGCYMISTVRINDTGPLFTRLWVCLTCGREEPRHG